MEYTQGRGITSNTPFPLGRGDPYGSHPKGKGGRKPHGIGVDQEDGPPLCLSLTKPQTPPAEDGTGMEPAWRIQHPRAPSSPSKRTALSDRRESERTGPHGKRKQTRRAGRNGFLCLGLVLWWIRSIQASGMRQVPGDAKTRKRVEKRATKAIHEKEHERRRRVEPEADPHQTERIREVDRPTRVDVDGKPVSNTDRDPCASKRRRGR
eukprot:scaffold2852_cov303-Pavlova_lutheri.AAC.6